MALQHRDNFLLLILVIDDSILCVKLKHCILITLLQMNTLPSCEQRTENTGFE